jgi:hypothetical protein
MGLENTIYQSLIKGCKMNELRGLTEYKSEDLEIAISNYRIFEEFYKEFYIDSVVETAECLYRPTFWSRVFIGKTLKDVYHKRNPYAYYAQWVVDKEGYNLGMSDREQELINLYYSRWSTSILDDMSEVCWLHSKGNKTCLNLDLSVAVKFFLDIEGLQTIKQTILEGYACRKQLLQQ